MSYINNYPTKWDLIKKIDLIRKNCNALDLIEFLVNFSGTFLEIRIFYSNKKKLARQDITQAILAKLQLILMLAIL